jgi:type IV pilus assembly protein PilX
MIDPLSEAGKIAAIDLSVDALRCFSDQGYVSRTLTQNGLQTEKHHITNGQYDRQSRLNSWSLSAFVQARACRGSSSVMGSADIQCHVFLIRGCGQIKDNQYAVANTLSVSVMTSVLP